MFYESLRDETRKGRLANRGTNSSAIEQFEHGF